MIYSLGKKTPQLMGKNYIAPNATVIGSVFIEKNVSIWFNTVVRGDNDVIRIGEGTNIQDGCVLHIDKGVPLTIGKHVTVGHKAILHSCTVGDGSLIGMNAVVLNHAEIGKNCLIGANALVTEKMKIPDGSLVLGSPAIIKRTLSPKMQKELGKAARNYIEHIDEYLTELVEIKDE
jgi:carbonic anhydrase/acetyltransferase-like protein (isoleucine patch superfamily)